jgi:hypothetical protein
MNRQERIARREKRAQMGPHTPRETLPDYKEVYLAAKALVGFWNRYYKDGPWKVPSDFARKMRELKEALESSAANPMQAPRSSMGFTEALKQRLETK